MLLLIKPGCLAIELVGSEKRDTDYEVKTSSTVFIRFMELLYDDRDDAKNWALYNASLYIC